MAVAEELSHMSDYYQVSLRLDVTGAWAPSFLYLRELWLKELTTHRAGSEVRAEGEGQTALPPDTHAEQTLSQHDPGQTPSET